MLDLYVSSLYILREIIFLMSLTHLWDYSLEEQNFKVYYLSVKAYLTFEAQWWITSRNTDFVLINVFALFLESFIWENSFLRLKYILFYLQTPFLLACLKLKCFIFDISVTFFKILYLYVCYLYIERETIFLTSLTHLCPEEY